MTYKLLIVDDEQANIRLLERLFRQDYFCLTAASGEEAFELLDQHEVAVIITDQRMPGMNGVELCRTMRASARISPATVRSAASLSVTEATSSAGISTNVPAVQTVAEYVRTLQSPPQR